MLGNLLAAGASLAGGFLSSQANSSAAQQQYEWQKQFAKNAIRWKVEDANKAGVHPLFALGANTTSFSPVSVGDTNPYQGMASAGQDLSRAFAATKTSDERAFSLRVAETQLEGLNLDNEIKRATLASAIKRITTPGQTPPPLPGGVDPARKLTFGDVELNPNPNESQQDAISKEYGDEGLPQIPGQSRFIYDSLVDFAKRAQDDPMIGSWARSFLARHALNMREQELEAINKRNRERR